MKRLPDIIVIRKTPEQPGVADFRRLVDYYLTMLLLKLGPGMLWAEPCRNEDPVEWRHRCFGDPRGLSAGYPSEESDVVDRLDRRIFRPMLARMGTRLIADEDPYGGCGLFQVRIEDEPQPRESLLSVHFSNEPTIGIWVRFNWYGPLAQVKGEGS